MRKSLKSKTVLSVSQNMLYVASVFPNLPEYCAFSEAHVIRKQPQATGQRHRATVLRTAPRQDPETVNTSIYEQSHKVP